MRFPGLRGTAWCAASAALGALSMVPSDERQEARAANRAAVEAREIAFARSMAERDLEAFATFVSPEAVFFGAGEPLRGREAVVERWSAFFEGDAAPFSWRPDTVEVLDSGRLALSSGPVRDPAGEVVGRFNSIWRKDADGVWRVVFDKGS